MPSDELEVLHTVVSRLERARIGYMLSGSTALGAYATPRMTRDIEIVMQLESGDVDMFVRLFADDFYCDAEAVRRSVAARGIVNLIHLERVVKVDMIVRKDAPYRRLEFERRRRMSIDGQDTWIVSPEDLVLSKLSWAKQGGSAVQMQDVRDLLTSVQDLDWPYVERWGRGAECVVLAWRSTPMSGDTLDTTSDAQARYRAMIGTRSPSDRVVMACGMFDVARAMVLTSCPRESGEADRRAHLFMRFYAADFDADTAARICARLRAPAAAPTAVES